MTSKNPKASRAKTNRSTRSTNGVRPATRSQGIGSTRGATPAAKPPRSRVGTRSATVLPELAADADVLRTMPAPNGSAWKLGAACVNVQNYEVFFPTRGEPLAQTIEQYCLKCPVRMECLAVSMQRSTVPGLWGGRSANERRKIAALLAGEVDDEPAVLVPVPDETPQVVAVMKSRGTSPRRGSANANAAAGRAKKRTSR